MGLGSQNIQKIKIDDRRMAVKSSRSNSSWA